MEKIKNNLLNIFKSNKALAIIIAISFLASLSYSFYFQIQPKVDANAYDNIGWNLVQGNGYRESLEGPIELDYAITRIGPLYQFTLAGIYSIFGHHYEPVWVLQAMLHALTVWLVYLISILIFKENKNKKTISLIAATVIGFYPDLIEISTMLLIETFYLFLFCLALYIFFKYFDGHNIYSAVLVGVFFALATMARPPVLCLIPIVIFYFYQKKKYVLGIIFIAAILMVFTPWTVRNYNIYHKIAPLGVGGAFNFWIGNYHGANGEQEPSPKSWEYIKEYGIIEIQPKAIYEFKSFLFEHPVEFVNLTFLRINKYFSVARPMGWWFYQDGLGQLIILTSSAFASIVLFVFGLGGIIKAWVSNNLKLKYLLVFTIITPLIIFITVIETRYRLQIYPLLAIFTGYFAVDLAKNQKPWLNKILWISVAIISLNGLIDVFLSFDRIKERIQRFL